MSLVCKKCGSLQGIGTELFNSYMYEYKVATIMIQFKKHLCFLDADCLAVG